MQAGSSWVQSNISPCSQVPKYCPGRAADPWPTKARFLQMSAQVSRRVGAAVSPTPPAKCGAQALLGGGSKQLPGSCVCSVTRPELPGPLSCWPGSCLLLTVAAAGLPGSRLPALGRPHTPSPVFSLQRSCPRWSHGLGCGGWCSGREGGVKYLCGFVFSAATVSDTGRGLSAPGGRCRGPTGCSPYFLRSNWPPPPGRGFSRCLCEGS